jgi:glycolate oxidase FAD binding subunit
LTPLQHPGEGKGQDLTSEIAAAVGEAFRRRTTVSIVGGGSKSFYGRPRSGVPLPVGAHRGIVSYTPEELVLTARAGTPLAEIEDVLERHRQMLPFEPPAFGPTATLGGCVACGLSGPRRPYSGAVRDFVLGVRIVNGKGESLRFGGEVMKNVAGYDVARLMAGALGTLGVLLEVSLKVLPAPTVETTQVLELETSRALTQANRLGRSPVPLSAACFDGERLFLRLSGGEAAVRASVQRIGGESRNDGAAFWRDVREHRHAFFQANEPLWRVSVASHAPPLDLPGRWLYDWGGAQRWLVSEAPAGHVFERVSAAGGHATVFRGGDRQADVFHPLPQRLAALHQRLKTAFDPARILNPGVLYRDL